MMTPTARPLTKHLKPRRALEVAVVGNRRFADEPEDRPNAAADAMRAMASDACALVWQAIIESMRAAFDTEVAVGRRHGSRASSGGRGLTLKDFFTDERPRLGVLSSLAAGADQIGAEAAFAVGEGHQDVAIELEAILPFRDEDHPGPESAPRPEFRASEAERLRQLATRAVQVVRMDGRYDREDDRRRAYQQTRDVLLQNADALVAIYDPGATAKVAGTVETVGLALASGMPVFAVLVGAAEVRFAVYACADDRPSPGQREWEAAAPASDNNWRRALHERTLHLLQLPHQRPARGERPHETAARMRSLAEGVERLQIFFGERRAPGVHSGLLGAGYRAIWSAVLAVGRFSARRDEAHDRDEPQPPDDDAITVEPYASVYARASALSAAYMTTYRAMFVLSFGLAGTAVAAAVALLAASVLAKGAPPFEVILLLGGLKIGIIVVLLVIASASHRHRYQEHAADYRYLAELFRPMEWLSTVGATMPLVELPAHSAPLNPRHGWTPWLFRAVARATSCVSLAGAKGADPCPPAVEFNTARARAVLAQASREWIQGQIVYHWQNAQRMHWIDDGLERLARGVLYLVLLSAVSAWVLELVAQSDSKAWAEFAHHFHPAAVGLGAAAAALPAFIAALGGIMFQSEAKRLKQRSEAMYHGLRDHQRVLDTERAALEGPRDSHGGETWHAANHLRGLAAVLIQETGEWKVLYQTHEVHAG